MKKKAGFIMCDYAFKPAKKKMATRLSDLVARTSSGLDPVSRVRVVKR